MVAVGEAAAVVMTGVANALIGAGTDAGFVTCGDGDGAGTDDDLSSVGFVVGSSGLIALCWCIFFRLPFDGLPWGTLLISESIAGAVACFGLLLWGGFEAVTTAGLEIGFEEEDNGATSFLAAGFVVVVAATGVGLLGSFAGEVFSFRAGLTGFLSSSGSSKFSDRTVDEDRQRSLLEDSCSTTGFVVVVVVVVTLALAIVGAVAAAVVAVVF